MNGQKNDGGEEALPYIPKRRVKKHRPPFHGGNWKVAYADFITTMMALFLLLWLLTASDQATKNKLALYFQDPGIFTYPAGQTYFGGEGVSARSDPAPISEVVGHGGSSRGAIENQISVQDVDQPVVGLINSIGLSREVDQHVQIIPQRDGVLIEVLDNGSDPLFAPGSPKLLPNARKLFTQLGALMAMFPEYRVDLEGHTDGIAFPPHAVYTNWDLSLDRAQNAEKLLLQAGVPLSRINSVAGYADTRPFNVDDLSDAANRRISIRLTHDKLSRMESAMKVETEDAGKEGSSSL